MISMARIRQASLIELATGFVHWLQEGLGVFLPARLRDAGMRPVEAILSKDNGGNYTLTHYRMASWTGAEKIAPAAVNQGTSAPVRQLVALPPAEVYVTSVSLPAVARRDISAAIELRLTSICPIPPEEVTFACGPVRAAPDTRIEVALAITRAATIDDVMSHVPAARIETAIGYISANGTVFRFQEPDKSGRAAHIRKLALLAAGVIIALWGLLAFAARQENALLTYQSDLVSELRTLRETNSDLAVFAQSIRGETIFSSADLAWALTDIEPALSDSTLIATTSLAENSLSMAGFVPSEESGVLRSALRGAALQRSEFTDYDQFTYNQEWEAGR